MIGMKLAAISCGVVIFYLAVLIYAIAQARWDVAGIMVGAIVLMFTPIVFAISQMDHYDTP